MSQTVTPNPPVTPNQTAADSRDLFFLGVATRPRPGWEHIVTEPIIPPSYKGARADTDRETKKKTQAENAPQQPVTGYARQIVVMDRLGLPLLNAVCAEGDTAGASLQFMALLNMNAAMMFKLSPFKNQHIGVKWFGFDIRDHLSMIALEVLRQGQPVPPAVWLHRSFETPPFADPYHLVLTSPMRKEVSLLALCGFLGVESPPAERVGDPVWSAELARRLVFAAQLVQ